MIDRFRHSMQALQLLMKAQEVTANNLANMNTPGFKGDKLFYRAFQDEMNGRPVNGVAAHQTLQMGQGALESTGNPFDFAVEGNGFFQLETGDGNRYLTRNGRFQLDSEGFLVDDQGARVQGESGPVQVPHFVSSGIMRSEIELEVSSDGTISADGVELDRLKIVTVDDVTRLRRRTNSWLQVPDGVELGSRGESTVVQGFYESGNVDPLMEMVEMTRNMRLFESQQKAMTTTDEMLSQATNRLGKF